ncbi:MAG: RpiB/LacA/LacB family sugar-phosphate isomerase [Minisyncoccia bacterium]
MTIYFATDHAGFELKEKLLTYVRDVLGYTVEDCGAFVCTEGDDYPEFIRIAAEAVSRNPHAAKAIILGGSGQGEAIVANRFSNVRAVVYYGYNTDILRLSREHNDANVLSFGARFVTVEEAQEAVALWLSTPFHEEERHVRRISKIDQR